jgi:sulfite exporter TauE/SafE
MDVFLPMFVVGLVTSVHCVAMCGSMVLTYAIKGHEEGSLARRMLPHIAYQSAKIASYVLVGLLLGAIGSAFNVGGIRGWVTIVAGAFMITLGLQMTGKVAWARRLTLKPPKSLLRALQRARKRANADAAEGTSSLATPITFGLLTGLMPCGPLQSAQLAAAGAGSPLLGAVSMLGFGLGTMPLMLGFGAVSGMLSGRFKERMLQVAAVVVMVLGLVMLDRGAMLVGSPVTFDSAKAYIAGGPAAGSKAATEYKTGADGVVEVPLTIQNTRFVPRNLNIPADKPVRLIVDRREANACSAQLAIPQLGVLANLKDNGVTAVDIPAGKAGAYTLTCGMGMMSGSLQVGGGAAASGGSPLPVVLLALLGAGAVLAYRKQRRARIEAERVRRERAAAGGRGGRGGSHRGSHPPRHTPVPAPALVLGFTPPEAVVIVGAFIAAIAAGLALGGAFG